MSIIAHIWRPYPIDPDNLDDDDVEQKGPIATQKCYWYFGNNLSIAFDRATGLETFGLESPDDVNVHITLFIATSTAITERVARWRKRSAKRFRPLRI